MTHARSKSGRTPYTMERAHPSATVPAESRRRLLFPALGAALHQVGNGKSGVAALAGRPVGNWFFRFRRSVMRRPRSHLPAARRNRPGLENQLAPNFKPRAPTFAREKRDWRGFGFRKGLLEPLRGLIRGLLRLKSCRNQTKTALPRGFCCPKLRPRDARRRPVSVIRCRSDSTRTSAVT